MLNALWLTTTTWNHPLDQFEIAVLANYWPNQDIRLGVGIITKFTLICLFNAMLIRIMFSTDFKKVGRNNLEWLIKESYNLVKNLIQSNTSLVRNQYFLTIFFLFFFILIANFVGLIPYTFTMTSSFLVTFFLAFTYYIGINLIGVFQYKWKLTNIFLPSGVPIMIAPFLILIEVVSYIAKVLSLSIRLFANMMSGHALLKILIGFSWSLVTAGSIYTLIAIVPWVIVTGIMFLEALIAFLQAYVFTILVTIYINDVLVEH